MWRADLIRYWRRSGLKNPDKLKIFIKKNVKNHSYHQFCPVLAKIRINRGLLYYATLVHVQLNRISCPCPIKPHFKSLVKCPAGTMSMSGTMSNGNHVHVQLNRIQKPSKVSGYPLVQRKANGIYKCWLYWEYKANIMKKKCFLPTTFESFLLPLGLNSGFSYSRRKIHYFSQEATGSSQTYTPSTHILTTVSVTSSFTSGKTYLLSVSMCDKLMLAIQAGLHDRERICIELWP